jgi:hypothetical protein
MRKLIALNRSIRNEDAIGEIERAFGVKALGIFGKEPDQQGADDGGRFSGAVTTHRAVGNPLPTA